MTTTNKLAKAITDVGYKAEIVEAVHTTQPAKVEKPVKAEFPDDAPAFFRTAFEEARKARRPMVIDFWAEWCAPCQALKKETFGDPNVSKWLAKVAMIYVDLDKYPDLGKAYGVASVPDVLFIDRSGMMVDRLQQFEAPAPFLLRLKKIVGE